MDNIIYKMNDQTYHKDVFIRIGDSISFIVELDLEATGMVYACAGNLHGDVYEFQKELGDGITDLGDYKYQVIVNSADTQNMTQGSYNHNLRVDTSDGTFTILDGLIFVESNIGDVEYSGKKPNILNYNSFIDGTLKEASVLNAETIPQYMFNNCNNLLNIIMPNVTRIEERAFNNCTNLAITSLPSGITTIVSSAFYGCTNLTSLTFNGTPTRIDRNAFYGCTNLTDIYVPWSEGAVANAPWGATNATIHYNS